MQGGLLCFGRRLGLPPLYPAGSVPGWSAADLAAAVPGGGVPALSPPCPALACFPAPYPPDPLPLRGRGRPKVYFAGGFAPGTPTFNRLRHLQNLPSRYPAGGVPALSPPCPALACFPAPYPPDPLPRRGRGRPKVYFAGGYRPRHPCTKPLAALTEPAKQVPGRGLYLLQGRVEVAFRYPAGVWRLGRGTGEQCRQPRRGGTGGEELRRLRWSSPPGQG